MSSLAGPPTIAPPAHPSTCASALAPRVDQAAAAARLARSSLWERLIHRSEPTARLELVHLPFRQATVSVRDSDSDSTAEPAGELSCLVCANTGLAFRFDPAVHSLSEDAAAPLPARLDAAELDRRALELLRRLAAVLGRPRVLRLDGPPRAVDRGYPIWLALVERGTRLDVTGIDALSGERIGSATRQALLLALASTTSET